MKLYFDKACIVEDVLYFTTSNTAYLFKMDINKMQIRPITKFAINPDLENKFANIIYEDGILWFIPYKAMCIWSYEITTGKKECYEVPIEDRNRMIIYRDAVIVDKIIYALPVNGNYIRIFDLKTRSYSIFNRWIDGIITEDNENKLIFSSITAIDKKLYISTVNSPYSIIFDTEKDEDIIWERRKEKPLEYMWYISFSNEHFFRMPIDGQKFYMCNIKMKRKEICISLKNIEIETLSPRKSFIARQILPYKNEKYFIISYLGDSYLIINNVGNVIKKEIIFIEEKLDMDELEEYINGIVLYDIKKWRKPIELILDDKRDEIGRKIWDIIS